MTSHDTIQLAHHNVTPPPQGVVVMYDITNRPTFLNVPEWIDNTREYGSANTQIVLVGNKKDREDREVSPEEGHKLARMHRVKFYETSALTGENCDAVSEALSLRGVCV